MFDEGANLTFSFRKKAGLQVLVFHRTSNQKEARRSLFEASNLLSNQTRSPKLNQYSIDEYQKQNNGDKGTQCEVGVTL